MSEEIIVERANHLLFASKKLAILKNVTLKQEIFAKNDTIVFIHHSKTGGTNIEYLVKALAIKSGFKHLLAMAVCKKVTAPNIFTQGCLGGTQEIKNNPRKFDCIKNNIKFISGHMVLPANNYFKANVSYISLVRDPVDRALSSANYLYQRKFIEETNVSKLLLSIDIDNLQTRALAGEKYMSGQCTDDTFERAVYNIQHVFKIVAPMEEVNVVLSIIANHFGFQDIAETLVTNLES